MEKGIIVLQNNEPRAGTWNLSKGFEVEHRALKKLVNKYFIEFEEFGVVTPAVQKPQDKGGRPVEEFLLNENQAMYLGTLLTNNIIVREFKRKLVKDFTRMKTELIRIASQTQNAQWLETRKAGKETRRIATDTIEKFIDYATEQGSKNAIKYYANISKMENKALFLLEQRYKNLRDALDIHQLSTVKSADMIVMKALLDGIDKGMHYKDIYKHAKNQVESFAELIGKTLIPSSQLQLE
jgi:phage regulator Rha-like protein